MSSFVHTPNPTRISLHYRATPVAPFKLQMLNSKFGIAWIVDPESKEKVEADIISGKEAGTRSSTLVANQRAILTLGVVSPYKYQCMFVVNPEFDAVATVVAPRLIEPKETTALRLVINAHKAVDLNTFDWYVRMYLFE